MGFALKRYHASLECSACHGSGTAFSTPPRECENCHSGGFKNLNHANAAGFALDEFHASLECEACHEKGYAQPPDCSSCHDDKTYPKDRPGT